MKLSTKNQKNKKMNLFLTAKKLKNSLIVVLFFMLSTGVGIAQNEKKVEAYWIHEDRVKPSMVSEYEQVSKDLVAACKKYNIQDTKWLAVAQDDFTYLYVSPIEKFADLDVNEFAGLTEKMGSENMTKLFNRFSPCYDEHGDYVVYLNKELSYMPGGIKLVTEGMPYRVFYYHQVSPSKNKNFVMALKKIKDLFVTKNAKMEYRVYKNGFGLMGDSYMIVISGANALEMAKSMNENWELMKEQFQPLLKEVNRYTWKTDEKTGWIREDLSYTPKQ